MMNDVVVPTEVQVRELKEYFVSEAWKTLKKNIENEIEGFREFILDPSEISTSIDLSYSQLLQEANKFFRKYQELFPHEHIKRVIQVYLIEDNEQRIVSFSSAESRDKKKYSKRDFRRYLLRVLNTFLSFERVFQENNWQDKKEDNNGIEGWLDSLWEWVWISS